MKNVNIEKIEIKKTKVQATISIDKSKYESGSDEYMRILFLIMLGGNESVNILKQVTDGSITDEIYEIIKKYKLETKWSIQRAENECRVQSMSITKSKHTFF